MPSDHVCQSADHVTVSTDRCFKQFDPHLVIRMVETTFLALASDRCQQLVAHGLQYVMLTAALQLEAPNLYPAREALPLRLGDQTVPCKLSVPDF